MGRPAERLPHSDLPAEIPCVQARLRKEPAAALCSHWPCPQDSAVHTSPQPHLQPCGGEAAQDSLSFVPLLFSEPPELLLLLALALLVRTPCCVIPQGCWYCFGRFVCQGLSGPALHFVLDCVLPFLPLRNCCERRGAQQTQILKEAHRQDRCGVK